MHEHDDALLINVQNKSAERITCRPRMHAIPCAISHFLTKTQTVMTIAVKKVLDEYEDYSGIHAVGIDLQA